MTKTYKKFISEIDEKKTIENGKKVCLTYKRLIEERIHEKMRSPIQSGSLIQVSSDIHTGSGVERSALRHVMQESDQVQKFINKIYFIKEEDPMVGTFLEEWLIRDEKDINIAKKMNISKRHLYRIKQNACWKVAAWANQIAYIHKKSISVSFDYKGLYDKI